MAQNIPLLEQAVVDRQRLRDTSTHGQLWDLLDSVCDPEIPVLSLWELGVLQNVDMDGATVVVTLTPTYSGCPALTVMQEDVQQCLRQAGYTQIRIAIENTPTWGTHFLTDAAKAKLRAFQIAPPTHLACPNCGAEEVAVVSEFSATACKSMYRCLHCLEPFEYFKPL